jgi:hypothetical protein
VDAISWVSDHRVQRAGQIIAAVGQVDRATQLNGAGVGESAAGLPGPAAEFLSL